MTGQDLGGNKVARAQESDGWNVYRDGSLTHFPGPNPGTPYTACMLDAGTMVRAWHPATNAGIWCTDCLQKLASKGAGSG